MVLLEKLIFLWFVLENEIFYSVYKPDISIVVYWKKTIFLWYLSDKTRYFYDLSEKYWLLTGEPAISMLDFPGSQVSLPECNHRLVLELVNNGKQMNGFLVRMLRKTLLIMINHGWCGVYVHLH